MQRLPEYLAKRKAKMAFTRESFFPPPLASDLDPATLLGNAARMFPMPYDTPLNMDEAVAVGIPSSIPYPYQEFSGAYTLNEWDADYQCWLDWQGVAWPIAEAIASGEPLNCQQLATDAGDSFLYKGVVYQPGPWMP
jgi:hypothetical protein